MLHRFDPFSELSRLQDDMARAIRRESPSRTYQPAVDIFEEQDAIVVLAELPGVRPDDVNVTVDNGMLSIEGERKFDRRDEQGNWHRVESVYGKFTRSFALPKTVSAEAIEANLDAGVLTVRLPKRAEVKPRKVEVKASASRAEIPAKA
jgi:HSP20 family protein